MYKKDDVAKFANTRKVDDLRCCLICDSTSEVREFKENYICRQCVEIVKKEYLK